MLTRRFVLGSAAAYLATSLQTTAAAQQWPNGPVKIIYPFAAGSPGDITARLFARRFSEVFGQPFVVENRPGASGSIAVEAVARAPADGHTLLWALSASIAIFPAMAKVPFDPVKDFVPI